MAAKRSALGSGYRSQFMAGRVPVSPVLPGKGVPGATAKRHLPRTQVKASIWIEPELLERARDTVDALSGPPERLTFTALLHRALDAEIVRLAKRHHDGRPFPKRSGELRRGTRRKV